MEKRLQQAANDWNAMKSRWAEFAPKLAREIPGLTEEALQVGKTGSMDAFVKIAADQSGALRDEVYRSIVKVMAKLSS